MTHQTEIALPSFKRGFHLITHLIEERIDISSIRAGLLHVFIKHTSASLTINENADPDVLVDMESSMNAIAPENFLYVHPDGIPAHVKASMMGSSVSIPISGG